MQARQGTPKRSIHRWTVLLFVAALIATTATPVLGYHDWVSGCNTSGNTCWREAEYGGGWMQSDHRDAYMYPDKYVGNDTQRLGLDTDSFRNRMNETHAHIYKYANYSTELFCVNPGSTLIYSVHDTTTHSWKGHSESLSWCRS